MFKASGHNMLIFPFSSPLKHFEKEAEHVEGFAKECVIGTHIHLQSDGKGGLKPTSELDEPLIVRQTSETVIEKMFSLSHVLNCGRRDCQKAGQYISHKKTFLQDNKKFPNYQ
jgi:prolyl-tRNA synthetase